MNMAQARFAPSGSLVNRQMSERGRSEHIYMQRENLCDRKTCADLWVSLCRNLRLHRESQQIESTKWPLDAIDMR